MFQAWRGIGAGVGLRGGWSQGWSRCLRWDGDAQKAEVRIFNYPVWLVRCRGGRARLVEVYQKGRGAIRLPTDMLSLKLPQLLDIHQVPKVRPMLRCEAGWGLESCSRTRPTTEKQHLSFVAIYLYVFWGFFVMLTNV